MGKVYAYVRDYQNQNGVWIHPEKQERLLREYAKKRGIDLANVYCENDQNPDFGRRKTWSELESIWEEGDLILIENLKAFSETYEEGIHKYLELLVLGYDIVFVENKNIGTEYIKSLFDIAEFQGNMTKSFWESLVMVMYQKEIFREKEQHAFLSMRTKEGMRASGQKAGRKVGQVDKMTEALREDLESYLVNKDAKAVELMRKHHVSRNTLKKYVRILVDEKTC